MPLESRKTDKYYQSIFKSLTVLFLVSSYAGIIPFSIKHFVRDRVFRSSWTATGWCLLIVTTNTVLYHFALGHTAFAGAGERDANADSSSLTAIIGVFIIYLEPVMMIVDTVSMVWNYKRIAIGVDRLAAIDERLDRARIPLCADPVRRITLVYLAVVIVCEIGLVAFHFVQFQISENAFLQFAWWFYMAAPLFSNSITRLWFIISVTMIRLRFKAMNEYLCRTHDTIKEAKDKYSDRRTCRSAAGYLSDEIFHPPAMKRSRRPANNLSAVLQASTKVHAMPEMIINTVYGEVMSLNGFRIDTKMDNKFQEINRIHGELREMAKMVNGMFALQNLLTMTYGFGRTIAQFYFIYCGIFGQPVPLIFRSAHSFAVSTIFIFYISLKGMVVVHVCYATRLEAQRTGLGMHKVATAVNENHFYQMVNHLSLKLLNNRLVFSACGLFELDMTSVYKVSSV